MSCVPRGVGKGRRGSTGTSWGVNRPRSCSAPLLPGLGPSTRPPPPSSLLPSSLGPPRSLLFSSLFSSPFAPSSLPPSPVSLPKPGVDRRAGRARACAGAVPARPPVGSSSSERGERPPRLLGSTARQAVGSCSRPGASGCVSARIGQGIAPAAGGLSKRPGARGRESACVPPRGSPQPAPARATCRGPFPRLAAGLHLPPVGPRPRLSSGGGGRPLPRFRPRVPSGRASSPWPPPPAGTRGRAGAARSRAARDPGAALLSLSFLGLFWIESASDPARRRQALFPGDKIPELESPASPARSWEQREPALCLPWSLPCICPT